jgi:hypothetical protein
MLYRHHLILLLYFVIILLIVTLYCVHTLHIVSIHLFVNLARYNLMWCVSGTCGRAVVLSTNQTERHDIAGAWGQDTASPFSHPTSLFQNVHNVLSFLYVHGLEICKTAIICHFLIAAVHWFVCRYPHFHGLEKCKTAIICCFLFTSVVWCMYRDAVFWLHQSTDVKHVCSMLYRHHLILLLYFVIILFIILIVGETLVVTLVELVWYNWFVSPFRIVSSVFVLSENKIMIDQVSIH